ncbi:hypothetical protein GCM10010156_33740 [Planobispora rosea]|uniref:Uncharacterized protein n=1 Tax=Planobispora rosea TaxID=35762 RepID=A0A8J3S1C6_PLARO|nr:hypothetical protein GCM10010156_33740 [Planobispora rosea]GIH85238.1 hypothetical protein Pro02_36460 [Planobispora rosea]
MLDGRDQLDAVERPQRPEQERVPDRVEGRRGFEVDGGVQVGEGVVPVELGGPVTEHRDDPERGGGHEEDREDAVVGEGRENGTAEPGRRHRADVCEHAESDRRWGDPPGPGGMQPAGNGRRGTAGEVGSRPPEGYDPSGQKTFSGRGVRCGVGLARMNASSAEVMKPS